MPVLADPPAEPAAVIRYATEAPWCASYAERTRWTGQAYAALALLGVATCHRVAYALHATVGATPAWTPGDTDPTAGPVARWAARLPQPPSLAAVAESARESRSHPAAVAAVLAATALLYAAAFLAARPGRVLAAFPLVSVVLMFT